MKQFTSQISTSIEQSQRLLAMGLKPETADMVIIYKDDCGNEVPWEDILIDQQGRDFCLCDKIGGVAYCTKEVYPSECGCYDHSYTSDCPSWSLSRLLEITENAKYDCAGFPMFMLVYNYSFERWEALFRNPSFKNPDIWGKDILDVAYRILVFSLEHKLLKEK